MNRRVPIGLALYTLLGQLGGQLGWGLLLVFGTPILWVFGPRVDVAAWLVFRGDLDVGPARVVRTESMPAWTEGRRRPITAYEYVYTVEGTTLRGVSYGSRAPEAQPDGSVLVEHPPGRPEVSRLRGLRRTVLPGWHGLVFLFPLGAAALIAAGLRAGRDEMRGLEPDRPSPPAAAVVLSLALPALVVAANALTAWAVLG